MGAAQERLAGAIGRRVRQARSRLELTQAELAERLRLEESTVRSIEAGRRGVSVETLLRLADALHVPPGALLEDEGGSKLPVETEAARIVHDLGDQGWQTTALRMLRELHRQVRVSGAGKSRRGERSTS
jgi:transcriptional regulator with XRE-family HTH domain